MYGLFEGERENVAQCELPYVHSECTVTQLVNFKFFSSLLHLAFFEGWLTAFLLGALGVLHLAPQCFHSFSKTSRPEDVIFLVRIFEL